MQVRRILLLASVALPLFLGAAWLYGQKNPSEMSESEFKKWVRDGDTARLAGLKGVSVKTHHRQWDEVRLMTAVELRLRQHGVPILDGGDFKRTLGTPILCAQVNNSNSYVDVQLNEEAMLVRDPTIRLRPIVWESTGQRFTPQTSDRELRQMLLDEVDEFCNAYLAANPPDRKPQAPPTPP